MSKDGYIMLDRLLEKAMKSIPEMTDSQKDAVINIILEAMEFGKIEMAGEIVSTIEQNTVAGYTFD